MPTQAETIEALRKANLPVDPTYTAQPYDPMQAVRMFGSALGIDDAIKALRGEMTPDEQQKFAVTAAMGLGAGEVLGPAARVAAKTMGELLPEMFKNLPRLSKLTPEEFYSKVGPAGFDYLKPELKAAVQPYLPKTVEPPSLAQTDIDKYLAKNPGASIFDIAGESSPYSPKENHEPSVLFKNLGRFPQDMPYAAPPKALEHNFVQPAIHGTRQPEANWTVPGKPTEMPVGETGGLAAAHGQGVDALRLPQYELGVHFGTPDQAHEFAGLTLGSGYLPRTYPTVLQTGNSLELPDLGSWGPSKVVSALRQINRKGAAIGAAGGKESSLAQNTNLIGRFPDNELDKLGDIGSIRKYLSDKGYDSINYINTVEGESPQRSYIMFKPSQEEPDYVGGVRSPFAAFDPAKLGSPALAAGVAGAGTAGAMSPQISEYIKALQGDQQQ